ncbi:hypothetical protein SAY86_003204 [Trapa natans]|nr:hypothetical protein SAY86_003204 [Trapa natans]
MATDWLGIYTPGHGKLLYVRNDSVYNGSDCSPIHSQPVPTEIKSSLPPTVDFRHDQGEMASQVAFRLLLVAAFAVAFISSVEAQSSTSSCAQDLVACADYLNSTKPPASCCNPIKKAVDTERTCLCSIYKNPELLSQFNVNITQALQLTQACGVNASTSLCNDTASSSPTSAPAAPGVPGNDAGRKLWSGLSGLVLLWATMMLY